jgi:hypothetical protein
VLKHIGLQVQLLLSNNMQLEQGWEEEAQQRLLVLNNNPTPEQQAAVAHSRKMNMAQLAPGDHTHE